MASTPGKSALRATESMSIAVPSSLAIEVFTTTELLEQILLHLRQTNIFGVIRVNKTFRDIIQGSLLLKWKMNILHKDHYSFETLVYGCMTEQHDLRPNLLHCRLNQIPSQVMPMRITSRIDTCSQPEWACIDPFISRMVLFDTHTKIVRLVLDLGTLSELESGIGLEHLHLYSFNGNSSASWTAIKLLTIAMPLTVTVNTCTTSGRLLELNGEVGAEDRPRFWPPGGVSQTFERVLDAEHADFGTLCAFLEEVLSAARVANRPAHRSKASSSAKAAG